MHALSSNLAIKETSMKRKILWAFLIIWLILTAYPVLRGLKRRHHGQFCGTAARNPPEKP